MHNPADPGMRSEPPLPSSLHSSRHPNLMMDIAASPLTSLDERDQSLSNHSPARMRSPHTLPSSLYPSENPTSMYSTVTPDQPEWTFVNHSSSTTSMHVSSGGSHATMRHTWTPHRLDWTTPITTAPHRHSARPSTAQGTHPTSAGPTVANPRGRRLRGGRPNLRGVGPNGETRPAPLGYRRMLRHELRVLQQFHAQVEPEQEPLATDSAVESWYWSSAITDIDSDRNAAWETFLNKHSSANEIALRVQAIATYRHEQEQQPEREKAWKRLLRTRKVRWT